MQEIWEYLYPYGDFPNIKLMIEEGDYALKLQTIDGKWINVDGIASGGERSIAVLALRVSFSLVLAPSLKILILDEPTHNLDNQGVEELANLLRERLSSLLSQIFIITHNEHLESAITGNLYHLTRDKSKDMPTIANLILPTQDRLQPLR
jgi:DNA repair exonuclease SbcCD ATPase subunit